MISDTVLYNKSDSRTILNPRSDHKRNNILRTFDRIPYFLSFLFLFIRNTDYFVRTNLILFAYQDANRLFFE